MKCKSCKAELMFVETLGWLHPKSDCNEWDGLLIDDKQRDVWNKEYPENSGSDLIKSLKKEIKVLEKELLDQALKFGETNKLLFEKEQETQKLYESTYDFRVKTWLGGVKTKWKRIFFKNTQQQ